MDESAGIDMFLDGPDAKARDAVHVIFSGPQVRPEYDAVVPDVADHLLTGVHVGTANEMAHVQNSDIHATNGVSHVIDKVIMP